MTALTRVVRRIVRKALKPIRLWLLELRAARAAEYAADLAALRELHTQLIAAEEERLEQLAAERMQIERGLA